MLHFRVCFNSDWGENVSFEKIPTEHQCLHGLSRELGKIPLQNLSQPSWAQVSAGTKTGKYTLWRGGFYQAPEGSQDSWHLDTWQGAASDLCFHFPTFLWKRSPCQHSAHHQKPSKRQLTQGQHVSWWSFTRFGGLWRPSASQNSLDSHWNASEQWFC